MESDRQKSQSLLDSVLKTIKCQSIVNSFQMIHKNIFIGKTNKPLNRILNRFQRLKFKWMRRIRSINFLKLWLYLIVEKILNDWQIFILLILRIKKNFFFGAFEGLSKRAFKVTNNLQMTMTWPCSIYKMQTVLSNVLKLRQHFYKHNERSNQTFIASYNLFIYLSFDSKVNLIDIKWCRS